MSSQTSAICIKCGYLQPGDTKHCRNCNAAGTLRKIKKAREDEK